MCGFVIDDVMELIAELVCKYAMSPSFYVLLGEA